MEDLGKLLIAIKTVPLWILPLLILFIWLRDLDKTSTVLSKLWSHKQNSIKTFLAEKDLISPDLERAFREIRERQAFRIATGIDASKNRRSALISLRESFDDEISWPQIRIGLQDIQIHGDIVTDIHFSKWFLLAFVAEVMGIAVCLFVLFIAFTAIPLKIDAGEPYLGQLVISVGYGFALLYFIRAIVIRFARIVLIKTWRKKRPDAELQQGRDRSHSSSK